MTFSATSRPIGRSNDRADRAEQLRELLLPRLATKRPQHHDLTLVVAKVHWDGPRHPRVPVSSQAAPSPMRPSPSG